MSDMTNWLLFTYKVPREPSARRVYVWRKLKGLGAILLHDTAWELPATPHTREKLRMLNLASFQPDIPRALYAQLAVEHHKVF